MPDSMLPDCRDLIIQMAATEAKLLELRLVSSAWGHGVVNVFNAAHGPKRLEVTENSLQRACYRMGWSSRSSYRRIGRLVVVLCRDLRRFSPSVTRDPQTVLSAFVDSGRELTHITRPIDGGSTALARWTMSTLNLSTLPFLANNHMEALGAQLLSVRKLTLPDHCNVSTLGGFAPRLVELTARGALFLTDEALADATQLSHLSVPWTSGIKSVAPFAQSLTYLRADQSAIGDEMLRLVTNLRMLGAQGNPNITTCAPFAESVTMVNASSESCGIGDEGLAPLRRLRKLFANDNPKITSLAPFADTLEVLEIRGGCGVGDFELERLKHLKTVDAAGNPLVSRPTKLLRTES